MKNTVPSTYRADHNGLTEVVSALPAEWYFDAAHHEQEMKTLWQQNWLYICRAESLHEPGSLRMLTVGDQAYLLVRTPAGFKISMSQLRALPHLSMNRSELMVLLTGRERISLPFEDYVLR